MTDILQNGLNWLNGVRNAHMTNTVTYARGESTVQLPATVGKTVFRQSDEFGLVMHFETRDFLVSTADLVLDGQRVLPCPGDRITQSEDGKDYIYEVMSPGGEPHFRYSDPYMKVLRIHTKNVGGEE